MSNYQNFWASLMKFSNSFSEKMLLDSITVNMGVVNFDAFSELEELDQKDLIGPRYFSVDQVHSRLYQVSTMFVISTYNDPNLFRLENLMGRLFDELTVGNEIPLFNADTGNRAGSLIVQDGVSVGPVLNTKTRPLRGISVMFGSDRSSP